MNKRNILPLLTMAAALAVSCSTQKEAVQPKLEPVSKSDAVTLYIDRYCETAMDQMKRYGIPASITLAQGILESDAGRSSLAVGCNNHFGIKCHSDWNGNRTYRDDDRQNECFRCYDNARESFEDHSLFLKNGSRYSLLFKLSPTDYKAWAAGLKSAGYATDKSYADHLTNLVERYSLDRFDKSDESVKAERRAGRQAARVIDEARLEVLANNGCRCIRMENGMSLKDIAKSSGMSVTKLCRINDMPRKMDIPEGTLIYLDRKKTRAEKELRTHQVGATDSLWLVSQRYGVRMSTLARRNGIDRNTVLTVGQTLKLR